MSGTKFITQENVTYSDSNRADININSPKLLEFIQHPENVPTKVGRPFLQQMRKKIEELFDIGPTDPFATFSKPPDYLWYSLKTLFINRIVPGIDIDESIKAIDHLKVFEGSTKGTTGSPSEEIDTDDRKVEKVLSMLYSLIYFDGLLKDIRTRMTKIKKA